MTYGAGRIIGVDFDNTLIAYDDVFHALAVEFGFVSPDTETNKTVIRDKTRLLEDGDVKWQRLQAEVYGPRIAEGKLIEGAVDFFRLCREKGERVYIISQKTEFSPLGDGILSLRTAALGWMELHGFFDARGFGMSPENVFFHSTRDGKIGRIRSVACEIFIDDLEEVFMEPEFPSGVEKILFLPLSAETRAAGVKIFRTWKEITRHVFG